MNNVCLLQFLIFQNQFALVSQFWAWPFLHWHNKRSVYRKQRWRWWRRSRDNNNSNELPQPSVGSGFIICVRAVWVNSIQICGKLKPKSNSTQNSLQIWILGSSPITRNLIRSITTTTIVWKMMLGYGILHLLKIEFVCTTRRQCIGEWLLCAGPPLLLMIIFMKKKKL